MRAVRLANPKSITISVTDEERFGPLERSQDGPLSRYCLACGRPAAECPATASRCHGCSRSLATGVVAYEAGEPDADPAETWTPPGAAVPITDASGHPLTFGAVLSAHAFLVRHASCTSAGRPADYDSDDAEAADAPCPCGWHPVLLEERSLHEAAVALWPGPLCGSCWAASCRCGYTFDALGDAAGVDSRGRLVCYSAGCRSRVVRALP